MAKPNLDAVLTDSVSAAINNIRCFCGASPRQTGGFIAIDTNPLDKFIDIRIRCHGEAWVYRIPYENLLQRKALFDTVMRSNVSTDSVFIDMVRVAIEYQRSRSSIFSRADLDNGRRAISGEELRLRQRIAELETRLLERQARQNARSGTRPMVEQKHDAIRLIDLDDEKETKDK